MFYLHGSCVELCFNVEMLLQQTSKTESKSYDSSYEQRLPILADLVLYYCRYAARKTLIQLYQAEVSNTLKHSKGIIMMRFMYLCVDPCFKC